MSRQSSDPSANTPGSGHGPHSVLLHGASAGAVVTLQPPNLPSATASAFVTPNRIFSSSARVDRQCAHLPSHVQTSLWCPIPTGFSRHKCSPSCHRDTSTTIPVTSKLRKSRTPTPSNAYFPTYEFLNLLLVLLHGADACAGARMAERVHLPIKPASALQTPPTSTQPVRFPVLLDCSISVQSCHPHPPHTPSKTKPAENTGSKIKKSL